MKYRYTGFGDRVFSEQDFVSNGVNDQGDVVFVDSNQHEAELTDDAARFLKEVHHEPFDALDDDGNVTDVPYEVETHETAANADEVASQADGSPQDATAEDQATTEAKTEPSAPSGDTAAGAASTKASSTRSKR